MDEILVKGTHLAGKLLFRQISAQELDGNSHFEGFWFIRSSPEPAAPRGIFNKEISTTLMSQLKSNRMVQWVIWRQFKFLKRQGDSRTSQPQSLTSVVKGSKEKLDLEFDIDNNDDEEVADVEEEREDADEDDKKTRGKKCKNMINGSSMNRWCKLAEKNLVQVMKSTGVLFKGLVPRHALRLQARKRLGETGLLDHLLEHVASKLEPWGADRFRRRPNADGKMQYWSNLVKVGKEAGVQDPWTPPLGWRINRYVDGWSGAKFFTSDQLPETNSSGMVRRCFQCQVKYRQGDSGTSLPQFSKTSVQGSKGKLDQESDDHNVDENDDEDNKDKNDGEDNEDLEEEREDTYEDDKSVKRKTDSLRENT